MARKIIKQLKSNLT